MMPRLLRPAKLAAGLFGLVLTIGIAVAPPSTAAPANESVSKAPEPLRVVFSESMFMNVNANDAKASVKAWGQQMAEELDVDIEMQTRVENDLSVIEADLLAARLEMVALTSREFLEIADRVPVGEVLLGEQAGKPTQEYILLVRQEGPVQSLAGLQGKTLITYESPLACFAPRWLDLLLQREEGEEWLEFFGSITATKELTGSVLPVFFGQADACLVTRVGYELMAEMNPQVGNALHILASSPPVVPMVLFVRDGYKPELRDKAVSALLRVDESASGRQLLTLFHTSGLSLASEDAFSTARALRAGIIPPVEAASLAPGLKE